MVNFTGIHPKKIAKLEFRRIRKNLGKKMPLRMQGHSIILLPRTGLFPMQGCTICDGYRVYISG